MILILELEFMMFVNFKVLKTVQYWTLSLSAYEVKITFVDLYCVKYLIPKFDT